MIIPPTKVPSSCNPASVMIPPVKVLSSCNPASVVISPTQVSSSCNPASVMILPAKVPSSCDRESVIILPVNISSNCYPSMPANSLIPPTPNSSSSSIMITELNDGSFDSSFLSVSSIDLIIPAIPTDDGMVPPVSTSKANGSDNEDFHYKWELLSSAEITPIYVKSRNRNNSPVSCKVKYLWNVNYHQLTVVAQHPVAVWRP